MALSAASSQQKMTRTDWKKEKELEEARKAGTAPALQDETGKYVENIETFAVFFKLLSVFELRYQTV
jgi:hypothetical protein